MTDPIMFYGPPFTGGMAFVVYVLADFGWVGQTEKEWKACEKVKMACRWVIGISVVLTMTVWGRQAIHELF